MKKYQYTMSPNGIPIYHLKNDTSYLSHIVFWFNLGSRYEHSNYYGMVHLIEHLLLQCHYQDEPLRNILNEKGIEFRLSTSYEYFYLLLSCKEEDVEEIMEIILCILNNPIINNISFVNEKKTVMLEKKSRTFIDQKNIQDLIIENIWDDSLSHSILGTELSLTKIKLNQIISVVKYLNDQKKFTILYSGKKSMDDISKTIDRHFSYSKEEENMDINLIIQDTVEPATFNETNVMIKVKDPSEERLTSFVALCYEFENGLSRDEKIYLSLFSIMMTMNDNGFLYDEFRRKEQIVYFIVCLPVNFKYESILQIQFITEQKDVELLISRIHKKITVESCEMQVITKYLEKSKKFLRNKIYEILENDKEFLLFLGNAQVTGSHYSSVDEMLRIIEDINSMNMQTFVIEKLLNSKMKQIIIA